jgi:hypothetical protein
MAYLFLILTIFTSQHVMASSCCGQSPASFTVLSLDQRFSLSSAVSYTKSIGRIYEESDEFYIWSDKTREVHRTSINLAGSLGNRQQGFIKVNLLNGHYSDSFESGKSSKLSDTLVGYTFEALPEYTFSYWKPIIYLTAFLNIPTGHSIFDQNSLSEGTEVTGHSQWGVGAGITLKKVYFPYTLTLQVRTIELLEKQFTRTRVSSFYDHSVALLINYASNLWNLQFNSGLTWTSLSPKTLAPSQVRSGGSQSFNVLLGLQKSITENWVGGVSYSDQTLVGPAFNSLLNKSLSISFNYNQF